jgi:cephalosporin hydroxylase
MNRYKEFSEERARRIASNSTNPALQEATSAFLLETIKAAYSYNYEWLGRPIIQYPQDIVAMQELIWEVKPDLIVETGIAHGGSLIFNASLLALVDYCQAIEKGEMLDTKMPRRRVLGIDVDIRSHNRAAIEAHPLANRIDMIEGSSIASDVIERVYEIAKNYKRVLISLDSNHTHEHVLAELEAYAPLTGINSYCVVFDTVVEDLPNEIYPDRPWNKLDNPKTAVWEYLRRLKTEGRTASDGEILNLEIDKSMQHKLLITVAPDGYLKRVK